MEKKNFEASLQRLHDHKMAIGRNSMSNAKYAMNNLCNSIKETILYIKTLEVPNDIESYKFELIAKVEESFSIITHEYYRMEYKANGFETISNEVQQQKYKIKDALRHFDDKALSWIRQNQ